MNRFFAFVSGLIEFVTGRKAPNKIEVSEAARADPETIGFDPLPRLGEDLQIINKGDIR